MDGSAPALEPGVFSWSSNFIITIGGIVTNMAPGIVGNDIAIFTVVNIP